VKTSNYLGLLFFDRNDFVPIERRIRTRETKIGYFAPGSTTKGNRRLLSVSNRAEEFTSGRRSRDLGLRKSNLCHRGWSLSGLTSLLFEKHSLVGRHLGNRPDMNRTLVATLEKEDFVDFLRVYQ